MDGEARRVTASWENGTLAPVDRLRTERADSPTPGLVEGTEPGAGQKSAMFVHAQSFEDLTAEAEQEVGREA
ncbi:Protein SAND, partial [Nibea albiflora]